jgi:hypothetical protein
MVVIGLASTFQNCSIVFVGGRQHIELSTSSCKIISLPEEVSRTEEARSVTRSGRVYVELVVGQCTESWLGRRV